MTKPDDIGYSKIPETLLQPLKRKTDCWPHQCAAYSLARNLQGFMLAMEMGTGKTKTAIDLIQNWEHNGDILVICPKAVIATWPHEFDKHCVEDFVMVPLRSGTVRQKTEFACDSSRKYFNDTCVFVVNYEAIIREPLKGWLAGRKWSVVILDESHRVKSAGGAISRHVAKICKRADRRLLLTGTPMPHSPLDLYGQFRALDPTVFGTSFTRFRGRYAVTHPEYRNLVYQWINQDDLQEKFFSRAFRVRSEDVLDLPEKIDTQIPIELSSRAWKVYKQLEGEMIAQVEAGEITAANALVKLLRLQQITGGTVGIDDGTNVEVDDGKYQAVCDIGEDLPEDEPLVVFCRFRSDIDMVKRAAVGLGRSFGELSGHRNDLAGNQLPAEIDGKPGYLFAVQIASGGSGVDFTRACHCVYYSIGYSLGEYEQSVARLHRPGQTRPVRYYHLIAEGTVDEKVYATLKKRGDVVSSILDSYLVNQESAV